MSDLLTLGQYRRSVLDYAARLKQDNIIDRRAVAVTGGSSYLFLQYAKERFAFSLDWVAQTHAAGRTITDLDTKTEYMEQLSAMRHALSAQEKQDEGLLGQLDTAQKSIHAVRMGITLEALRKASVSRLESMLTHGSVQRLFVNRGLMEYELQNAAALQLQCQDASRLFTRRQLNDFHVSVPAGIRPLMVYMPTMRLYFEREGQWLPSAAATSAEQRSIATGAVPVRRDIQYIVHNVYDISQLPRSCHKALLAQSTETAYTYESLRAFAAATRADSGFAIQLTETDMPGISVGSFYDAKSNTIFVDKNANPAHVSKHLLGSIAEATVSLTSNQPAEIRQFETAMLSLQLQAHGGIAPTAGDFARVSDAFAAAQGLFGSAQGCAATMGALEASFARVDRMAGFVHHHVGSILCAQEAEQAQAQAQAHTQAIGSAQQKQGPKTEQLTNFMGQID